MARIYRTEDGRHVAEGDEAAVALAYGEDDPVPAEVLAELGVTAEPEQPVEQAADTQVADESPVDDPAEKQAPAPPNKARRAAANKSGA